MTASAHIPVMTREIVSALSPRDGGFYVDGTFGGGGHARAILDAADCALLAIDRDPAALARAEKLAALFPGRLTPVQGRFSDLKALLKRLNLPSRADGVALDLGLSSFQIADRTRGFSFQRDDPLDMRMSGEGKTAADYINAMSEDELSRVIAVYGEEKRARAIARTIRAAKKPLRTTGDLARAVLAVRKKRPHERLHPATQTFQALRILVNDELNELEKGLLAAEQVLAAGGRLAVISFHSLEDRIVKTFLARRAATACRQSPYARPVCTAPAFLSPSAAPRQTTHSGRVHPQSPRALRPPARRRKNPAPARFRRMRGEMRPLSMTLSQLLPSDCPKHLADLVVSGATADSRKVRPGFLFAALPGQKTHGLQHLPQSLRRGASIILSPSSAPPPNAPHIASDDPRRLFALALARLYPRQPPIVAAVTGTNGKSSVAAFTRHIWKVFGFKTASIGTLGIQTDRRSCPSELTTPAPDTLHRLLHLMADKGVTHLVLEASSHGLHQRRLDGVRITSAAFTNLTHDHLDYHASPDDYLKAKLRLFSLLPPGARAIVGENAPAKAKRGAGAFLMGRDLKLLSRRAEIQGQTLEIAYDDRRFKIRLPLIGSFQAENALVAAALAINAEPRCRADLSRVFAALESLAPLPGRLEPMGQTSSGASVYVDYAHTPHALESALQALKEHEKGRISLVFGCGGGRDKAKRALMGAIAARLADDIIVTDDNPRFEDPAAIRAAIRAACPTAREIPDRGEALAEAMASLKSGGALLIAGKGHEDYQDEGGRRRAFSDRTCASRLLQKERGA